MFCSKCGSLLEDDSVFCSSCGERCEEDNTQSSTQGGNLPTQSNDVLSSNYPQSNMQGANYGAPEQTAAVLVEDSQFGGNSPAPIDVPPKKKKKKIFKVLIPVVAVILIVTAVMLIFGRTIFYSVSPETYVADLIKTTADDIEKEWTQVEKNVFGFDVTMNEEMTAGVSVDFSNAYSNGKVDYNIANDPKNEKLLLDGYVEVDDGEHKANIYGYLDNENMGIMLPGSDGKYLSVPSNSFGKKLSKSDGFLGKSFNDEFEDSEAYDVLRSLDLSYGTIKQTVSPDKKSAKKVTKHVADNLIKFLEKTDIGERQSTKYEFEDKTVNAHEITLTVNVEDVMDLCIDICEDINNDDKINKLAESDALIDALKDAKKELENYEEDIPDFEVTLIEYNGKIVSVEISAETSSNDGDRKNSEKLTLTISATNRDKLLNGITVTVSRKENWTNAEGKDNHSEYTVEIVFTSNWATKSKKDDNVITLNADVVTRHKYDYYDGESGSNKSGGEIEFEMDFGKGKWKVEVKPDDSNASVSYSGKCSKKDGFSFSINEDWKDTYYDYESGNSMTYNEWIDDKYDSHKDSYLRYIYDEYYYYDSDYDSYYDWRYSDKYDLWDNADKQFEDWLYDEYYRYDFSNLRDAYDDETYEEKEIAKEADAHVDFKFTLKNEVDVKEKSGKNSNVLKWEESDFEDFAERFNKETQ